MSRKQKKLLIRIIIAASLFLIVLGTNIVLKNAFNNDFPNGLASIIKNEYGWILPFILYFIIYLYISYDVLKKSLVNILHGQILDEDFLMVFASIAAFALGIYSGIKYGDPEGFDEACAVILFFQIGEWFESYAAQKSRKSIKELMDIKPEIANLYVDSKFVEVSPEEVMPNSIILVKPGQRIPLDGIVIKGESSIDTKDLTGESLPRDVFVGSNVISGTINMTSSIEVRTTKTYSDSTVAKILDLVENASSNKSKSEAFITKFARYYTPIVVAIALLVAVVPPLIYTLNSNYDMWSLWIYRALMCLVVSCPCALVISVPMSFFAGLGYSAKRGILIKGSIHLEKLNDVNTFIFDKTGTLTKGNFKISKIYPEKNEKEIIKYAAIAEADSIHPIAKSIKDYYKGEIELGYMTTNISGKGIISKNDINTILVGNEILMKENNIKYEVSSDIGSICYVALNNKFLGYIVIEDEIKESSFKAISNFRKENIKTIMLSGDNYDVALNVKNKLGLDDFKSNLLPQDKVYEVNKIKEEASGLISYVGDGINDAPSIVTSDIGIAMGDLGAISSIEAADIVLMHGDISQIIEAKKIAKLTMKIVKENIIFALVAKVAILILSILGITNMWLAVFGDVGVLILCILNAFRIHFIKNKE